MNRQLEAMGENAFLLRLGDAIDADVNARVHGLCRALRATGLPRLQELVPAYASILLRFDSVPEDADAEESAVRIGERIHAAIDAWEADPVEAEAQAVHEIPVCYDPEYGEDLAHASQSLGLSVEEVVRRHSAADYRVAMIGFAPGFPYLLGMDPALQLPRRTQPRTRVPAGSVAIGGAQTGIYPRELPGGWQLIGRTPLRLFDPENAHRPCLLAPGDRVRFIEIGRDDYARMQAEQGT